MIGSLALAHLWIALPAIALSVLLSVPIARWAAFSRRGGWVLSALSALYAVPSLPLLIVIPVIVGVALRSPINMIIVLTLYGVAVLVRQVAEGFRAIPRATVDAARAIGLTEKQVLAQVEAPHAAGLVAAGVRSATLQVIATTTLAAYTANYGLGRFLYEGLKTRDYAEMIGGAIIVVALALATDALLAYIARRLRAHTHSFADDENNSLKETL